MAKSDINIIVQGVIELEILRAIARLSGCSIPDLFDWVVATSIGGIFALAMVYGMLMNIVRIRGNPTGGRAGV